MTEHLDERYAFFRRAQAENIGSKFWKAFVERNKEKVVRGT